jgi:hypothetical protein
MLSHTLLSETRNRNLKAKSEKRKAKSEKAKKRKAKKRKSEKRKAKSEKYVPNFATRGATTSKLKIKHIYKNSDIKIIFCMWRQKKKKKKKNYFTALFPTTPMHSFALTKYLCVGKKEG